MSFARKLAPALVVFVFVALGAAPTEAQDEPVASAAPEVKPGGEAVFLTFLNAPLQGAPLRHYPKLSISVAGGQAVRAVMDTGSTGVVVAARLIPNLARLPVIGRGEITYTSSGRIMRGTWVRAPVTIAGTNGGEVTTRPMPVLALERVDCVPTSRRCKPVARPFSIAIIGVGFARQPAAKATGRPVQAATAQGAEAAQGVDPALQPGARVRNAFLSLTDMGTPTAPGAMRPAYLVTRRGVWLGLTPDMLEGFHFLKLQKLDANGDWGPIPACISVDGRAPPACGIALVDTGVTTMFLTLPPTQLADRAQKPAGAPLSLAPGAELNVTFGPPGSTISYGFRTGDADAASAPGAIILNPRGARVFVNTGVRLLNAYDYLYDAEGGFVGFRPIP